MIKFRHFLLTAIILVLAYACNNDTGAVFDHASQALKDRDTILKFLENHYYDDTIDSIKPLITGKTALINDTNRLKKMEVTENDIDYTMYYIIQKIGQPVPAKEYPNPTVMDSILATYHLDYFIKSDTTITAQDNDIPNWYDAREVVVRGWNFAFTKLKSGENVSQVGEPIQYINTGKGVFIMPSGLAYRNSTRLGSSNANLIYYLNLLDFTTNTDHDNDNVASMQEDPDGDGDPRNDDTDKDGIINLNDPDDDNDTVITKKEDRNNDGNPANDMNDPENPTLADYLNPKIRG